MNIITTKVGLRAGSFVLAMLVSSTLALPLISSAQVGDNCCDTSGYSPDTTSFYSPDTTSYYSPDTTSYYSPDTTSFYSPDTTSYYSPDTTSFYSPDTTSYYSPDTTSFYSPDTTSYYSPDTTSYYSPDTTSYYSPDTTLYYSPDTTSYYSPDTYSQDCGCYTSTPSYSTPSYSTPSYSYSTPRYSSPSYSTPSYHSTPSYSYSTPTYNYSTPTYHSTPSYSYSAPHTTPAPQPQYRPQQPQVVYQPQQQQQQTAAAPINIVNNNNNVNTNTNPVNVVTTVQTQAQPTTYQYPVAPRAWNIDYVQPIVYQQPIAQNYNPVSCSITASPTSIRSGDVTNLSWTSNGAYRAMLSDGIGAVGVNSSLQARPSGSVNYMLTVYGQNGNSNTCNVYVTVGSRAPYVSLSQIPYTGFDFGTVGNSIYWLALLAFALSGAYMLVYFRGGAAAFASTLVAGSVSKQVTSGHVASKTQEAQVPVGFASYPTPVTPVVAVKQNTADTMVISRSTHSNQAPRIVISRI